MDTIVELTEVTKVYNGSPQPALDRVSLRVRSGEFLGVMGPSGSGKSTLLNLIAGLDRATDGSIRVDGVDLGRLSETALARYRRMKVGLIFQFFNLLNNLTVLDNVLIPAQLAGVRRADALGRAEELLAELRIVEQRDEYPPRLSGGQRQRVAVARALINRPALLLADEPTGALDRRSGEQVIDLLRDLNRTGQTVLLVTHDPALAERCAGRVITLVDGAIAAGDRAALEAVQ
jgi:putative ABC transport system ATP-binding protein